LQKRHKYESIPNDYFSTLLLKDMYNTVKQSLSLPVELAADVNNSIKTILQDFSEENISKLQRRSRLIDLALQHSGSERNVILAIEAILPGIKDLDQGELHESEVGTTFVHPFLQALLAHEDDDQVARSSNTLPENGMEINRRPDYEVTMYEKYQPSYRSCYGEVKGEGHSLTEAILDFYRLAVFAKLELVSNNLTGVLCFQALGTSLTFYTLIHPNPAVYTFLEIATISIPKNKATIMTLMGYMDEIYKVACYHHTLNKSHKNNSKLPTLPFEFIQGKKKTLPMKRRPSLGALK
jgi:hypothetical protein